jgi:hypothetical protein
VPNRTTKEIREITGRLFDATYWQRTRERLLAGELPPAVESRLLAYAFGSPEAHDASRPGLQVNIGFLNPPPSVERGQVIEVKSGTPTALGMPIRVQLNLDQ